MATTITPAVLQALQTDVRKIFQSAFSQTPTFYSELATVVSSSTSVNTYAWMKQLPKMREWLGPRIVNGLEAEDYQLINREYELTVGVRRTDIEDDQLGLFSARVQMMAQQVAKLPDDLVLAALEAGTTNTSFDGVAFFSASHPLAPSGVQSNLVTGGTALNAANFAAQRAAMRRLKGYDDDPLGVNPNVLIVPPELEDTANTILTAAFGASGATNVQRGQARVLVIERLSDTNDWYLMDSSMPIKPFLFQNRKSPEFVSKINMNDDNVFWNKEYVWGADARAAAGYGPWWLIRKIVGA